MDSTYDVMEQKSLLDLGLCRIRRGSSNSNWLPEDLRKSIVDLTSEEQEHPILDWLRQIRFNCAGDFNDFTEFGNRKNVVIVDLDIEDILRDMEDTLRPENCKDCVGDDGKCKVDFSRDGHTCGGVVDCDPCRDDCADDVSGYAECVECCEDFDEAIERRSTTSDSDSSSQVSSDPTFEDLPRDESTESIVLRFGRTLSAISEASEENCAEHSECRRGYNVNSIFDDGSRTPIPPARRKARRSLPARLGTESKKVIEYLSSQPVENRWSSVDVLEASVADKDISGDTLERLFRSVADIPQAVRTEHDDSQEFLLIDRVCRSSKLKRRRRDHSDYGTYPVVQRRSRKLIGDISLGSESHLCKADVLAVDDYRQFLRSMADCDDNTRNISEITTQVEFGHLNMDDRSLRCKRSFENFEEADSKEMEVDRGYRSIDKDGLNQRNPLDVVDETEVEVFQHGKFKSEADTEETYANLETMDMDIVGIKNDGLGRPNPLDPVDVDNPEVEVFNTAGAVSLPERFIDKDGLYKSNPLDTADLHSDIEVIESEESQGIFIDDDGLDKPNLLDNFDKDVELLYSKESNAEYIDGNGLGKRNALDSVVESDVELLPSNVVERLYIDDNGLEKRNALDSVVESDVELLPSKVVERLYIDDNGLKKRNALDSVVESDVELLPSNVVERLYIDEDGLGKTNFLDTTDTDADVELIQPERMFHAESAVKKLKNVEEPETESVDVDGSPAKSNYSANDEFEKSNTMDNTVVDRYANLESSSEIYFDDSFKMNSMETKDNREDTEIIATEADGPSKLDPLEKNSPVSDDREVVFESFESDKSFYSALDRGSRSDSESCPESLRVLEELDEKKNWCTADEDEDIESVEAPKVVEKLYVNFPLKGNTENPDLETSTPDKPIRKRAVVSQEFDSGYSPSASRKVYEDLVDARIRFRERKGSTSSDIVHWINSLKSSILNDKDENDEDVVQWFSSNDAEGKIYFFEENSNESSWVLPSIRVTSGEDSSTKLGITTSSGIKSNAPVFGEEVEVRNGSTADRIRVGKTRSMVLINQSAISRELASRKSGSIPRDWPQLFNGNMCVLKEGSISRTKITENGKKLRKNWSTSHVVLTELFLLFFKDAKTFAAMKTGQSPTAKPDISVDLNGALVEPGERASSRKNVYIISTVLGLQVLIQSDNPTIANEWYQEIHSAISCLPSGFEAHSKMSTSLENQSSGKHFLDASSPEEGKRFAKIGRSRSVKIKRPEGSLEDLSGTAAERQTRIKAKLRRFFQRRPTMDSLVKNGIYKDEPAFGSYLSDVCPAEPPRIPRFVKACIEVLENNTENMKTDGLYRASGNLSQIQKIRLQVDQNNFDVLTQEEDVHVLTGALKLFFRELKEPLIPFAFFEKALNASMSKKRPEKIQCFKEIVKALPPANHDTLQFLLQHLLRVTSYQEYNRMHIPNLAIVFGPTLMWPAEESANMALDLMQQNLVIECLLSDYDRIFK